MTAQYGKLHTSRTNRIALGVCGGLEEFTGINAWWFRAFFLFAFLPGGIPGIIYFIVWLIMPKG